MPRRFTNSNPYLQIAISLIAGLLIGGLTFLFLECLDSINRAQEKLNLDVPFHLALAPVVLLLLILIKRNTLFFPTKVNELAEEVSSHYWSWLMAPVNFIGALIGHASGMSLGREGAVVLFSAGFVRVLKLSWSFWGPVFSSIGFSAVLGNFWVAPVFMSELFVATSLMQKLLGMIGSITAVLLGRQLGMPHIFLPVEIQDGMGFFAKFGVLLLLSIGAGFIMRYYKQFHKAALDYFQTAHIVTLLVLASGLAALLYLPEFRAYQSLSIQAVHDLSSLKVSLVACFAKLAFTLMATALGFLGGEFIPLVYAGVNWGGALFQSLGYSSQLGAVFGAFLLFAAGTRLKWTSFVLMAFLMGWSWVLWIFFVLTIALNFSGPHSLYQKFRQ